MSAERKIVSQQCKRHVKKCTHVDILAQDVPMNPNAYPVWTKNALPKCQKIKGQIAIKMISAPFAIALL